MKTKRPHAHMHRIATQLVERLRPACERIEIAGSIRRQKALVGDVEICCIAKFIPDLLGEPTDVTELDVLVRGWRDEGKLDLTKDGAKMKQFTFAGSGGGEYQVDLFITTPPQWGLVYMIRTGNAEFSKRIVTRKQYGGYCPEGYVVRGGWVRTVTGKPVGVFEERDLFKLWQMDYVEPEGRG